MSDAPPGRGVSRRPETTEDDAEPVDDRETDGLNGITLTPGPRRTDNVEMLVIEAEMVAEGHEPDNPAQPLGTATAEAFAERIEDTDLQPAWLRPWEEGE